jgi:hypothetical protein
MVTAVVKARDGSSIDDWDPSSTTSPDRYLADPDRIHAAVQALEDGGLTVDAIGDFTISFSGPADTVGEIIGSKIDTTEPEHPLWSHQESRLTLDPGHNLAAQIISLFLESMSDAYARGYGTAVATGAEVLATDLLIGEVGQTLSSGFPQRIKDGNPFPITDIDAQTKNSISNWKKEFAEIRRSARHSQRMLRQRLTQITIIEGSGGFGVEELLEKFGLDHDDLQRKRKLFKVRRQDQDQRAVYRQKSAWKQYRSDKAEIVIELLFPAVRDALGKSRRAEEASVAYRFVDGQTDANTKALLNAIRPLVALLNDIVGYLKHLQQKPVRKDGTTKGFDNLAGIDVDPISQSARRLDTLLSDPALKPDKVEDVLGDIQTKPLDSLRELLSGLVTLMLDDRNWAMQVIEYHSQMVAVAAQSLAAAASVPTTLYAHSQTRSNLWSADRAKGHSLSEAPANVVLSASFGSAIPESAGSWGPLIERRLRESAVCLQDKRSLYVLAASNNGAQDGRPSQNVAWIGADNVILVGGCEPNRNAGTQHLEWMASDATHGYRFTLGSKSYVLPDICTTTKGQGGGAVIYPTFTSAAGAGVLAGPLRQGPWRTGGGSSLSAPILAGLAATVWRYFDELESNEVKQVLLRSASPLDGGSFHIPTNLLTTEKKIIASGSNQVSPNVPANARTAGRAQLTAALKEAASIHNERCGGRVRHSLLSGGSSHTLSSSASTSGSSSSSTATSSPTGRSRRRVRKASRTKPGEVTS